MAVICQHCGAEAPDDRVMCPNCRRRLRPAGEAPQAASATQPAGQPVAVVPPEPAAAPEPAPAAAAYGTPEGSPWATPAEAAAPEPPRPLVVFARDVLTKSNRLTVGFRIFLAIPQLVVLWALHFALEIMGAIAWFAALFTKQVPGGIQDFITSVVRYQVRVGAYLSFMTDRYPPFSFSDSEYDVQYSTTHETHNRAAVFFRIILAVPAALLLGLVLLGYAVVLEITWFIVLIMGRLPEPLFDAFGHVLQYAARFNSYFRLVTPAYPAGLFNDSYAEAFGVHPDANKQVKPPRRTPTVKRLLTTFIVIGALVWGLIIAAVVAAAANQIHKLNDLRTAHNKVTTAVQPTACGDPSNQFSCLRTSASADAAAFRQFGTTLQGLSLSGDDSQKQQLLQTTETLARAYDSLALATTPQQYNALVGSLQLQSLLAQWDSDYQTLDDAVSGKG